MLKCSKLIVIYLIILVAGCSMMKGRSTFSENELNLASLKTISDGLLEEESQILVVNLKDQEFDEFVNKFDSDKHLQLKQGGHSPDKNDTSDTSWLSVSGVEIEEDEAVVTVVFSTKHGFSENVVHFRKVIIDDLTRWEYTQRSIEAFGSYSFPAE